MRGFANASAATPVGEVDRAWRPIGLTELKRRLQRGLPLPKDPYVDTDVGGLQFNSYRHRDKRYERAALHALVGHGSTVTEQGLALSIANCQRANRCRRLCCFICAHLYWRKRRALAERVSARCTDESISWCTVIFGYSQDGYSRLGPMIEAFKTTFQSLMGADAYWTGRIEVDYFDRAVEGEKPHKEATLRDLGWQPDCEMATLIPHAHLLIAHPHIHRSTLKNRLRKAFPASRQVQVRPLRNTHDRTVALDRTSRYPLKPAAHPAYLAGRNSKRLIPRQPQVVLYLERLREKFDRPSRRQLFEFDRIDMTAAPVQSRSPALAVRSRAAVASSSCSLCTPAPPSPATRPRPHTNGHYSSTQPAKLQPKAVSKISLVPLTPRYVSTKSNRRPTVLLRTTYRWTAPR